MSNLVVTEEHVNDPATGDTVEIRLQLGPWTVITDRFDRIKAIENGGRTVALARKRRRMTI